VAEKLLVKNGFSKNADGKWLLPDGTPWSDQACLSGTVAVATGMGRNCASAVQQWKRFGIDARSISFRSQCCAEFHR
jgi:peptide/nickel transport system substrate-binding protein